MIKSSLFQSNFSLFKIIIFLFRIIHFLCSLINYTKFQNYLCFSLIFWSSPHINIFILLFHLFGYQDQAYAFQFAHIIVTFFLLKSDLNTIIFNFIMIKLKIFHSNFLFLELNFSQRLIIQLFEVHLHIKYLLNQEK